MMTLFFCSLCNLSHHSLLGNVKSINLSGNKLETLLGFAKLYSLEYLDVSNNQISQVRVNIS